MQTKKLLGSTLALGMFFSGSSASAVELFKNLKVGGQMDLQAISAHNVTDFSTNQHESGTPSNNDRIGDMQTRLMINADWSLADDVNAKVSVTKNDRAWGSQGGSARTTTSQQVSDAGTAGVIDNIYVDQAFVQVDKVGGLIDVTLGRQYYGTSGDAIVYFGPSDKMQYGLPVSALDAARADWNGDWGGLTAIVAKIVDDSGGLGANVSTGDQVGDVDLHGLVATLKGSEALSGGAYVYNQVTHGRGGAGVPPSAGVQGGLNDRLWIVGAKAKANMGVAWFAAEIAKNFGENRTDDAVAVLSSRRYSGWMAKADAGAKVETGFGALAPWLHFGYGTGDDDSQNNNNMGFTAINGDYRPGTIYGTFSGGSPETLGGNIPSASGIGGNGTLSNRIIAGIGIKTTPSRVNKLTVGLGLWDFRTQTSNVPNPGANRVFEGNQHIGSEVDLDLNWMHSENVSFGAGVAHFRPGGLVKDAVQSTNAANASAGSGSGVNSVNMAYASTRIKFGGN